MTTQSSIAVALRTQAVAASAVTVMHDYSRANIITACTVLVGIGGIQQHELGAFCVKVPETLTT